MVECGFTLMWAEDKTAQVIQLLLKCLFEYEDGPVLLFTCTMATVLCKVNSGLVKAGLRPITTNNLLFYYTPIKGCVAYSALSIQVFNPELFQNVKFMLVPQYISLTNACLLNTLTGVGLYLYSRPHLAQAAPRDKLIYCGFGSVMFNLGSMLLWALGRTVAPESPVLRTLVGAAGAAGALYLGRSYIIYLDSLVKDREE